jgi:hypothetical protein
MEEKLLPFFKAAIEEGFISKIEVGGEQADDI